jgi:tetratricopeptide (TPR) repeat protein
MSERESMRARVHRALAAFVVVALVGAHAPEARADTPDRAAQTKAVALFERAQKQFQAGEYTAAIKLFAEAYELAHDPVYLFNLAQSYRKVLDCVKASEHFERYLAEASDVDAMQRQRVEQWLRELAPCVEQRREEAERARRAEEAERARGAQELQREPAKPPSIDPGRRLKIAGIVTASVGVVGMGLGGWYSVRGSRISSELAEECADGCDWELLRDKDSAGGRANTIAALGWIGGSLATAGGVALYLLGRSKLEQVQVTPVQGGATLSTRLSF